MTCSGVKCGPMKWQKCTLRHGNAQKEQEVTKGDVSGSEGYQEQFIIKRCSTYLKKPMVNETLSKCSQGKEKDRWQTDQIAPWKGWKLLMEKAMTKEQVMKKWCIWRQTELQEQMGHWVPAGRDWRHIFSNCIPSKVDQILPTLCTKWTGNVLVVPTCYMIMWGCHELQTQCGGHEASL